MRWMSLKKIQSFLKKIAKINSVWINLQNPKLKYCVVSSCLHRQNDSLCHTGHAVFEITGEDCGEQGSQWHYKCCQYCVSAQLNCTYTVRVFVVVSCWFWFSYNYWLDCLLDCSLVKYAYLCFSKYVLYVHIHISTYVIFSLYEGNKAWQNGCKRFMLNPVS